VVGVNQGWNLDRWWWARVGHVERCGQNGTSVLHSSDEGGMERLRKAAFMCIRHTFLSRNDIVLTLLIPCNAAPWRSFAHRKGLISVGFEASWYYR
jgi:hypothetical protein